MTDLAILIHAFWVDALSSFGFNPGYDNYVAWLLTFCTLYCLFGLILSLVLVPLRRILRL